MDNSLPFAHESLDTSKAQTRLLFVYLEAQGLVRCSISHFDIGTDGIPAYRALSYTWGAQVPVQEILINDRVFTVRQNLYDFLVSFRAIQSRTGTGAPADGDNLLWLWIDQVCIDQSSIAERNHQVGMMSSIYANASCVYIWLGMPNKHMEFAMEIMELNLERYTHYKSALAARRQRQTQQANNKQQALLQALNPRSIEALRVFCANPYWQRLWIVQEVMLAHKIHILCGTTLLAWKAFQRFGISGLGYLNSAQTMGVPVQVTWLASNALIPRKHDLRTLLNTFSGSQCEDPRDKIHGLQGLLDEASQVAVDYRKSVKEVFFDTALCICQRSPTLSESGIDHIHKTFNFCRPVQEVFVDTIRQIDTQLMLVYHLQLELMASQTSRAFPGGFTHDQVAALTGHITRLTTSASSRDFGISKLNTVHKRAPIEITNESGKNPEHRRTSFNPFLPDSAASVKATRCEPWQDHYIQSFVGKTQAIVYSQTRHFESEVWNLTISLFGKDEFTDNNVQTILLRHVGEMITLEFNLRLAARPERCSHQLHVRFEPRVKDMTLRQCQTLFRVHPDVHRSLAVSIVTGSNTIPTPAMEPVYFALDYDIYQHPSEKGIWGGTCVSYNLGGDPKHVVQSDPMHIRQYTPEDVLRQDKILHMSRLYDLDNVGGNRNISGVSRCRRVGTDCLCFPAPSSEPCMIWRTAAAGYRTGRLRNARLLVKPLVKLTRDRIHIRWRRLWFHLGRPNGLSP